eukprot:g38573.t1
MSSAPPQTERSLDTPGHSQTGLFFRIDFLFVFHVLSVRSTVIKLVLFSDHCLLLANCHLQRTGKGMLKLNVKQLTSEHIEELKRDYTGWRTMKPLSESPADWWETVKGNIRMFSTLKGTTVIDVTEDLQEMNSQQASVFVSDASKIIFRSRIHTVEQECEVCSHFFIQKVHRESSVHSSLKEEDGPVLPIPGVVKDGTGLTATECSKQLVCSVLSALCEEICKEKHKITRKWSAHSILEILWERERVDPVELFPEETVKVIWQDASLPELSNKHQDITWLVVRRALPARSF